MILSCQNLEKSFGTDVLISGGSFHVNPKEKAAIVGINGAGKSTLLNMITGELSPDNGDIILAKGTTVGYLKQQPLSDSNRTIYDELLTVKKDILLLEEKMRRLEAEMKHADSETLQALMDTYHRATTEFEQKDGYAYKSELVGVLKGLGFTEDEFDRNISTLSGGQKTRVALGRLLLSKPDLLLLDEPTNHLDITSIQWLETFLLNYNGTVVLVSHDRYFLDKIVSKVIEIERGSIRTYQGNYTEYSQKKALIRDALRKEYENQQREIAHQEAVIDKLKSFNREKSIKRAESREKQLAKIQVVEKPIEQERQMSFSITPQVTSGNDVVVFENLTKSFPPLTLFRDFNFTLKRGEHLAIIGKNGTGKTTLLKIINGLETADSGEFRLGSKVTIGYYDQEHNVLNTEKTIFEEISDAYPGLTNTQIRNTLAAFLFTGDDVFKRIGDLSGGERGRVSLAKLMLSDANFLILDEPTNHLDISSKEILEEALNNYSGTVLYVSHDRYFVNRTATQILELENESFTNYLGNYDYYLEKKLSMTNFISSNAPVGSNNSKEKTAFSGSVNVTSDANSTATVSGSASKLDWKQQKEEQARIRKRENDLKKTEAEIEKIEMKISEINDSLTNPDIFSNSAKLNELTTTQSSLQTQLDELYEKWDELSES